MKKRSAFMGDEALAERVRSERMFRMLTQQEAAAVVGIGYSTYCLAERGKMGLKVRRKLVAFVNEGKKGL